MTNKVLNSDIARQYDTRKSISDHLPWVEWSDAENIVLLEDLKSCGALLEIQDISTEAKPQEMIEEIHKNVKGVFQSVVPLEDKDPWIVQIYIQDDLTLDPLNRRLEEYVKDPNDPLTKKYLSIMARHFKLLGREQGMFRDPLSDLNFRGRTRRIRLAVYRRYEDENNKASKSKKKLDVVNELRVVTETLMTQLRQGGRCAGAFAEPSSKRVWQCARAVAQRPRQCLGRRQNQPAVCHRYRRTVAASDSMGTPCGHAAATGVDRSTHRRSLRPFCIVVGGAFVFIGRKHKAPFSGGQRSGRRAGPCHIDIFQSFAQPPLGRGAFGP